MSPLLPSSSASRFGPSPSFLLPPNLLDVEKNMAADKPFSVVVRGGWLGKMAGIHRHARRDGVKAVRFGSKWGGPFGCVVYESVDSERFDARVYIVLLRRRGGVVVVAVPFFFPSFP